MDKKTCQCNKTEWECWIELYDHGTLLETPKLWFSTGCHKCGNVSWIPYGPDTSAGTVPEDVLRKGLNALARHGKEVA